MAESCDADVELLTATQDADGWVISTFNIELSSCNRSKGTFDYIIYWIDDDGESGKPIKRVGNWGVQDTSQAIQVTQEDKLVDGQTLQVVKAGPVLTCVCHD
jgi:hypothetical protein